MSSNDAVDADQVSSALLHYTIGWLCALPCELTAARLHLEKEHTSVRYKVAAADNNTYIFGSIGDHNIVIATLPAGEYGTTSAATVARDMIRSFPAIKIGLMVGIGGGAPLLEVGEKKQQDIRLGDVVVSNPGNEEGGVYQYDYGKALQGEDFIHNGHLNSPPLAVRSAIAVLRSDFELEEFDLAQDVNDILAKRSTTIRKAYSRPDGSTDCLFKSIYVCEVDDETCSTNAGHHRNIVERYPRNETAQETVVLHYGLIASGNTLMKNANIRDEFAKRGVLCFETEAAGLMNQLPLLAIRGICDYSDSHKNKIWQKYAAMTAASYAKRLLLRLNASKVELEMNLSKLTEIQKDIEQVKLIMVKQDKDLLTMNMERWLAATDPSHDYHQALKIRHAGSGEWFLRSSIFQEWQNNAFSVLLLYGIPGCGKTVLASIIIEHLKRIDDNTEILLYFYLDIQDKRKQNLDDILRSLIRQMLYMVPSGITHLEQLYSSYRQQQQPETTELKELFLTLCQQNSVIIILDALDECTEPDNLFEWIKSISAIDHVRLILSVRIHEDIGTLLKNWLPPSARLALNEELLDVDMKAFIHSSIHSLQGKFSRWATRPDIKQRIEMHLTENAGGMFRWAVCQLDTLSRCIDPISLEAALSTLPKGLYETYDRILQNIPSELRDYAIRILQFLVYSPRAPLLEELVDAVVVRPDLDPAFDEYNRLPVPQEIAVICASLIQIVSRDITEFESWQSFGDSEGAESKQLTITEVRLAHASVKDYLLTARPGNIFSNELGEFEAKRRIVEISLAYIYEAWRRSEEDSDNEMPLTRYASQCWWTHARYAEKAGGDVLAQIQRLFTNAELFKYWLSNYDPEHQSTIYKEGNALYYASLGGLTTSVESLLHDDTDVNEYCGAFSNAITAASASGYVDIVKLLLGRGALVNGAFAYGGTLAYSAALWRQRELIRQLRRECTTTDSESSSLTVFKILHTAIRTGNEKSVETLLRHGSTFESMGIKFEDVIEAAEDLKLNDQYFDKMFEQQNLRERFHKVWKEATNTSAPPKTFDSNIAGLFVKPGIKINTESFLRGNALVVACRGSSREHVEIVELLLKSGARVFDYGGGIGTILQAAAYLGHLEIVELLLDHGADINTSSEFMSDWTFHAGTALQHASGRGHIEILKILLDGGADINREGSPDSPVFEDRNAIHAAVRAGNFAIVRLLLKHNANVDESVLQLASEHGHVGIIKLLNDSRVDTCVQTPSTSSTLVGESWEVVQPLGQSRQ